MSKLTRHAKRRQKYFEKGLCRNCGKPRDNLRLKECANCRRKNRERVERNRARYRRDHICIQCGRPLDAEDIEEGRLSHWWRDCRAFRNNR